jgi:putative mRNA 3-end processing factor
LNSLESLASINRSGAVLLGNYLSCDGFDIKRVAGAITHFHGDHLNEFENSLGTYREIFVTKATRDLLIALKGDWLQYRRNLIDKPYLKPFDYEDEKITLYPVTHVLGSARIYLETQAGKVLYTGDFRLENTPAIEADVLVIEATYGDPAYVRSYSRDSAVQALVSQTKKELKQGAVCILASRGKIQEVMNILYKADLGVPFLCHPNLSRLAEVYRKYGVETGNPLTIGRKEAEEIIAKRQPHVAFYSLNSRIHAERIYMRIAVSGWDTSKPVFYKVTKNEYAVSLSDHCDFKELVEYVKQTDPKLVIADNYRCANATTFAKVIKKQLKIDAKALPLP